ncbi:hypothetical protein [Halolamina sp.]|uniref:hypothetical protein n=1 Tax=Halolamina sp. TaxID=1940283 RepID=UPI0035626AC3
MSTPVLQGGNPFAQQAAYAVGGLFVLLVAGVWVWQRYAGPTADERRHTKAVGEALTQLGRVRPIAVSDFPAVEDVWIEIGHRLGGQIPMPRWKAIFARFRSRLGGKAVRCLQATDDDGQRLYLVNIDGRLLAHRSQEPLKEDVLTVLRALRTGDAPPATMSEWYARDVMEGRVDFERSHDRARGDCELRLQENLKRQGEIDIKQLYHRLVHDDGFRYPPEVVGSKLDQMLDRDVRLHRDGTLRYQRY